MAGLSTPLLFAILILLWSFAPVKNSQKYLLSRYLDLRPNASSRLIYLYDRPYSAEFYSSGKAIRTTDFSQIDVFSGDAVQDFFAVKRPHLLGFLNKFRDKPIRLGSYDDFVLLSEPKSIRLSSRASAFPYDESTAAAISSQSGDLWNE